MEFFELFTSTWKQEDGLPMVDYSSQQASDRRGKHAEALSFGIFRGLLEETKPFNFDIMLVIKDKEIQRT